MMKCGTKQKNYLSMKKANKTYTIGIDIGGTKMMGILFDGKKVISEFQLATPTDSISHFSAMLNALIDPLVKHAQKDNVEIRGIGIGMAGVVDKKNNTVLNAPNIGITNGAKLSELIKTQKTLPVKIDNDASCFLRAEIKLGAAKKFKNCYGVIIGTGVGGAWWYNGDTYNGSHGGAGEPGMTIVNYEKNIVLESEYQKLTNNNAKKLVEDLYRADPYAQKSFKKIGAMFGAMFAGIVNILDPEAIVVGGGAGIGAGDHFLPYAKNIMRQDISSPNAQKVKILKGKLDKYAGAIGAALLVD